MQNVRPLILDLENVDTEVFNTDGLVRPVGTDGLNRGIQILAQRVFTFAYSNADLICDIDFFCNESKILVILHPFSGG